MSGRRIGVLLLAAYTCCTSAGLAAAPQESNLHQILVGFTAILCRVANIEVGTQYECSPPLAAAAKALWRAPEDRQRLLRIRYAATKLAAGLVLLPPNDPATREFRKALSVLHAASLEPALNRVRAAHLNTIPALQDAAGAIIDGPTAPSDLVFLQRTCCPCLTRCIAGPFEKTAIVEFTVNTNRDPMCIFHVIDPLCWPKVTPLNFAETWLVDGAPDCTPPKEPDCMPGGICTTTTPPQKQSSQPSPVTAWCGSLFEHFSADYDGYKAMFENVLGVRTTTPGTDTFGMDYKLCRSVGNEMTDPGQAPVLGKCGIQLDCGSATVDSTGVPGRAELVGTKHIRFENGLPHDLNLVAPIGLEALAVETANATCTDAKPCLGAQGADCEIPPQPNCPCSHDSCTQVLEFPIPKKSAFCQ